MTTWDKFLAAKLSLLAKEKLTIDVGGAKPWQKELKAYQPLFQNKFYFSIDFTHGFKPSIVGDAHRLPFKSKCTKSVICKAVLEHVQNPHQVTSELYRVLKPGGKVLVYVPFLYPYHGDKNYKDYYRFTHDGLKELFINFSRVDLCPIRGFSETITNLLPSLFRKLFKPFSRAVDSLLPTSLQVSGYYLFAQK